MLKTLVKLLRSLVLAPVVVLLLFEEWGWVPLSRAFAALARLPLWARLERFIAGLPPWAALLAFGVPVAALLPIKLLALYLLGSGHAAWGVGLIVAAKLAGTAIAARLFQLTQPSLMKLRWFAYAHPKFKAWKDRLLAAVRASRVWQAAVSLISGLKAQARRLFSPALLALKAFLAKRNSK